jgi:hypothetical protein
MMQRVIDITTAAMVIGFLASIVALVVASV